MTPVAPDLTSVLPNATNLEPAAITQAASPNQTVSFQLDYQDTGSGTGTTGLGLRLHYNSNQLRPGEAGPDGQFSTTDDVSVLTNLFGGAASTVKIGPQDQADTTNFDGDASTDRFVLMSWADFSGQFPKGPAALLTANWTTTADFTGTTVNFTTSSRPPGRALNAPSAEITLGETNQVPVLETIGNQAVDEGQVLTFTIDATDADVPPDTLTYSATGLPPGATFDPTTRTFNWTPTEGQGPQSYTGITFTVTDGQGETDSETISVTVNEVNQAPVLNAIGTKTVTVGQPLTFTVTATDADLPANVLTFSSTTLPAGASLDATTGQFSWTPGSGQLGQTNLIFTVQDNGTPPLSDSEAVTITVRAEPNANPVAVNDGVYAATEDQLLTVVPAQGVLANDSDPNTDALSATLLTQATHGIITLASDGGFTYQPATDFNGNDSFTYSVSDGRGATASATVNLTVAPVNDAPVVGVIGNKTVQVGQPLTFTINATDADLPPNTLTFEASGLPTGATFDPTTQTFSWTPTAGQLGEAEITFTVTDDGSPQLSDSETITINVTPISNRNPVADNDTYNIGQDQVLNIAAPGVLDGDTDADGDELSIIATDVTGLQGELLQVTDGSFIFTPTAGFTGTTSYSYTVGDLVGGTDTGTVTITVQPVDGAPTVTIEQAVGQTDPTTTSPILFDVVFSEAVTGFGAEDISFAGSTVSGTLQAVVTGSGASYQVAVNGMTSNGDVVASVVTDAATDAGGNASAASTSADNTVTFNGIVTNVPPVAVGDTAFVFKGGTVTELFGGATSVLANDTDADGGLLTAILVSGPANGSLILDANGTFSYAHDGSETTSDSFTYKVNDGTVDGNTVTVSITVVPGNDAPIANDDRYHVLANEMLIIDAPGVLANDTDADGDTLTVDSVDMTGLQGTLIQVTDGNFTFTPNAGFVGTTSYRYTVTDFAGGTDTATVELIVDTIDGVPTVTIEQATGQTDPTGMSPILFDVVFSEGVTGFDATDLSFAGSTVSGALLASVTGSGSTYQVAVIGMTSNGTVVASVVAGAATDATGDVSTASTSLDNSVTFTGSVTNQAPVAVADAATVAEGGTVAVLTGGATSVLANDTDADGDLLSAILVTGPTNGSLTLDANGTFSYTHNGSETTSDSFTYKDNDGTNDSNTVMVTITVTPANDAPVVNAATLALDENSAVGTAVGTVTATDPDASQTLTFSITNGNVNGAFQINGSTGTISVANRAVLDFETTAQFNLTVQALDNGVPALSDSNTMTINLADVNETPRLTAPGTARVPENTTRVATVTASDPDAGSTLTFSLSGTDAAKFRLDGTGNSRTLRFVNAPDFERPTDTGRSNVYNVTVAVSDGSLAESKSIAVTVTDVKGGGSTPFVIMGTQNNDRIVVKEDADNRLSVTVNHKISQVHLQQGQAIQVFGRDGNDRIMLDGLKRSVLVDGGAGHDTIDASRVTSSRASLVLRGGAGGDLLVGGTSNDRVEGGDGEDVLVGNKGNDRLLGGNGNDFLIGGLGRDVLEGQNGNDALLGGPGRDSLHGGQGRDTLIGGSEDAALDGGPGSDLVLKLDRDAQVPDKQRKLLSSQPAWIRQFVG